MSHIRKDPVGALHHTFLLPFWNHGSARTVSHFLSPLAGNRLVNATKPILCLPFPFPGWSELCVVCVPAAVNVSVVHFTPGRGRPSSC